MIFLLQSMTGGSTHRVDGVDQLAGLAELHEALPKVIEGSFDQDFLLFVVVQQVVPKRLLGKSLGVPHDDHTIPSFTTHTRPVLRDGGSFLFFRGVTIYSFHVYMSIIQCVFTLQQVCVDKRLSHC